MVHVYRAAVYLVMLGAALVLYLLLRRFFPSRTRVFPVVGALLAATGLIWCTYVVLSKPALLRKYASCLLVKKGGANLKMVYMQSEVRICDPDGSGDELFLPQDFITTRDITWSPDGTRILCSRVRDSSEGMNLFIYDADGGNPFQLTNTRGIARRPSWSPDGTRIVFDFRPSLRQLVTELCVINADGSGRHSLTSTEEVHAYHPVWSPDGASIYCCIKTKQHDDLWVMDAGGGNLRQLTFTADRSETEPAISADGTTIVFSVNRRELYLMDADGSRIRPLEIEDGEVYRGRDPSWSPDSQRILFAGAESGKRRRFIMEVGVNGSGLRRIPVVEGKVLTPVLNPEGTRLAYLRFVKTVVKKVPKRTEPVGRPGAMAGEGG